MKQKRGYPIPKDFRLDPRLRRNDCREFPPYVRGDVTCRSCGYEWHAVASVTTAVSGKIACPKCGKIGLKLYPSEDKPLKGRQYVLGRRVKLRTPLGPDS